MKWLMCCILVPVGVCLAGCIADSEKTGDEGKGENKTAESYLPLPMNGVTAVWSVKKTFPAGQSSDSTYSEIINGPIEWDGNGIYTLLRSSPTNDPRKMYVNEDALFLQVERNMFGDLVIGSSPNPLPFGDYYKLFDFTLPTGVKATPFDGGTETDNMWCNFWITDERLGTETVTTPMGTFDACMKFRLAAYVKYTPKITGETVTYSSVETWWFGKNTGPLKRTYETYSGSTLIDSGVKELVSLSRP